MQIGDKLRKIRTEKKITQDEMAIALDISQRAYNKIENSKLELSVARMIEIVKILKIDITNLLEMENTHTINQTIHDNNGFVSGNYNTNYICEKINDIIKDK